MPAFSRRRIFAVAASALGFVDIQRRRGFPNWRKFDSRLPKGRWPWIGWYCVTISGSGSLLFFPGKSGDPGRSAADNRRFVEAVLWIVRVGAPWRDLPASFGSWNSVFQRFRRWAKGGVFERLFTALADDPDFEYAIIDGTIIRVHQHGIHLAAAVLNTR